VQDYLQFPVLSFAQAISQAVVKAASPVPVAATASAEAFVVVVDEA
jgi:hypothetical protein